MVRVAIWSSTVPMASFVTAAVAISGATRRSAEKNRGYAYGFSRWFLVGFFFL